MAVASENKGKYRNIKRRKSEIRWKNTPSKITVIPQYYTHITSSCYGLQNKVQRKVIHVC